jgi:hypothetical protein
MRILVCIYGVVEMKVVAKPIEVISVTDIKGNITPLRFKMIKDDESI